MFKKDVEHLFLLGVHERSNGSEWGAPSFAQPKHKPNLLSFLITLRNLNEKLKHKPCPLPNINKMILKLEVFQYSTSLGLNMG